MIFDYVETSNEEVITALANATKTYYGCNGHHKAEMNKKQIAIYSAELEKRNIKKPDTNALLAIGVFNGEGAY